MYGWLWRNLPGPAAVRVIELLMLAVAVIAACFLWIFPAIAPILPFNQQTVEEAS